MYVLVLGFMPTCTYSYTHSYANRGRRGSRDDYAAPQQNEVNLMDFVAAKEWTCKFCTFKNTKALPSCEICGNRR
jgi:hypothetical protein